MCGEKMNKITSNLLCLLLIISLCIITITSIKIGAQKIENNINLLGKTIYIDAGHGGRDNGANNGNVLEDQINLKISNYLYELLIDAGAYVFVTRTGDYDLASNYDKNRKRTDLIKRVEYINRSNSDIFISIHLNSFFSGEIRGAQVFHQQNENSKLLANLLQEELNILTSDEKKVKLGDYYILNKSNISGVIVECGFLSNGEEKDKLLNNDYQMLLAKRIFNGIVEYFNNKVYLLNY